MHCIVGLIHREDQDPKKFFERFLYDNEDFYAEESVLSQEEIEQRAHNENYECVEDYATDYGYHLNEYGDWVAYYNPLGQCDWFEIGGRWSGELKDWKGNSADSMEIKYIKIDESLKEFYAYVKAYEDDNTFYTDGTSLFNVTSEAIRFEVINDEDLTLTLIDMHT